MPRVEESPSMTDRGECKLLKAHSIWSMAFNRQVFSKYVYPSLKKTLMCVSVSSISPEEANLNRIRGCSDELFTVNYTVL